MFCLYKRHIGLPVAYMLPFYLINVPFKWSLEGEPTTSEEE